MLFSKVRIKKIGKEAAIGKQQEAVKFIQIIAGFNGVSNQFAFLPDVVGTICWPLHSFHFATKESRTH